MKLLAVLLISALLLSTLLLGCNSPDQKSNTAITSGTSPYYNFNAEIVKKTGMPYLGNIAEGSAGVLPGIIELDKVYKGALIDTWTINIPELAIRKHDELCVIIANNSNTARTFFVSYGTAASNAEYMTAPAAVKDWVTISDENPLVPGRTAVKIPISIKIPKNTEVLFPNKWEFRIVATETDQGNVIYRNAVRVLITMMK